MDRRATCTLLWHPDIYSTHHDRFIHIGAQRKFDFLGQSRHGTPCVSGLQLPQWMLNYTLGPLCLRVITALGLLTDIFKFPWWPPSALFVGLFVD
jgi:hypothetical protein